MAELAGATQPIDALLATSLPWGQLRGAPNPLPSPTNFPSLPTLLPTFPKQTQALQEEKGSVYASFTLPEHLGTVPGNPFINS